MSKKKRIFNSWYKPLTPLLNSKYFEKLISKINREYSTYRVFPLNKADIFKPFRKTSYDDLKVVIIGEKAPKNQFYNGIPYSTISPNFNLNSSKATDILEKLVADSVYNGFNLAFDVTMDSWTSQGVLMLNRSMTVSKISTHYRAWDEFIKTVVKTISENKSGIHFILIGNINRSLEDIINKESNYIYKIPPIDEINGEESLDIFNTINDRIEVNSGKKYIIKW